MLSVFGRHSIAATFTGAAAMRGEFIEISSLTVLRWIRGRGDLADLFLSDSMGIGGSDR